MMVKIVQTTLTIVGIIIFSGCSKTTEPTPNTIEWSGYFLNNSNYEYRNSFLRYKVFNDAGSYTGDGIMEDIIFYPNEIIEIGNTKMENLPAAEGLHFGYEVSVLDTIANKYHTYSKYYDYSGDKTNYKVKIAIKIEHDTTFTDSTVIE
ncbi:MAG: hypothetical protein Q7U71_04345 [bacterium]|nr:hypothetical protein [bacterium]